MRVPLDPAVAMCPPAGATTAPLFGPLVFVEPTNSAPNLVKPAALSSVDFSTARRTEFHPFSPLPRLLLDGPAASSGNTGVARRLLIPRAVNAAQRPDHRSAAA